MRKDVKIGLAVAGVLLAVLIVYLVIPKGDSADELAQNTEQTEEGATETGGAGEPETPAVDEESATEEPETPVADAGGDDEEPARPGDPFGTGTPGNSTGERPTAGNPTAGNGSANAAWGQLLNSDQVTVAGNRGGRPLFVTETPTPGSTPRPAPGSTGTTPAGGNTATPIGTGTTTDRAPTGAGAGGISLPRTESAFTDPEGSSTQPGSGANDTDSPGTGTGTGGTSDAITRIGGTGTGTGAVSGGGRTHVIQQGETLSSIAETAYGSAKYYTLIQQANPGLNERALKVGSSIKIPERAPEAPTASGVSTGSARGDENDAPVAAGTEYRVRPGDSLYRISVKLYGRPNRVDDLYELNRKAIGDDRERLKVGMVLKLPAAPTAGGTASTR